MCHLYRKQSICSLVSLFLWKKMPLFVLKCIQINIQIPQPISCHFKQNTTYHTHTVSEIKSPVQVDFHVKCKDGE